MTVRASCDIARSGGNWMSFGRTRNEAPFSGLEITSHLWWEGVSGGAARTRPFQGLFSQVERPRKETRVDAGRDRIVGSPATPARSPQDGHIAQGQPCNGTANGRRSRRARCGMVAVSYQEVRDSNPLATARFGRRSTRPYMTRHRARVALAIPIRRLTSSRCLSASSHAWSCA